MACHARRVFLRTRLRLGGAAPPAASRCCARASLRTPSRGDPPRRASRGRNAAQADCLCALHIDGGAKARTMRTARTGEDRRGRRTNFFAACGGGQRLGNGTVQCGRSPIKRGWGREGVRSEARAEQRLAPGGAQRSPNPEYAEPRRYCWLRTKFMVDSPGSLQSVSWMWEIVRIWRTIVAASSAAFMTSSAMADRWGGRSGEPTSISA